MGNAVGTLQWTDPATDPKSKGILFDVYLLMHKYGLSEYGHSITRFSHAFSVWSLILHDAQPIMYAFCNELQLKHPTVAFQFNVGVQ